LKRNSKKWVKLPSWLFDLASARFGLSCLDGHKVAIAKRHIFYVQIANAITNEVSHDRMQHKGYRTWAEEKFGR